MPDADPLAEVDIGPLRDVDPGRLLTDPALRFDVEPAAAAARALRYAHATGATSYDEIGARLSAAMPVDDVAPLQTVHRARLDRARADRTRADPRVERALREQPKLRHRPIALPPDGRYRYRMTADLLTFTRTWEDEAGRREEDWDFPVAAPPDLVLDGCVPHDAAPLLGTRYRVGLDATFWLPLGAVIRHAAFPRMQDCRDELTRSPGPGDYPCFVSHRWLTPAAPDPHGRQARYVAWQLTGHLCEAIRVAGLRGLHAPRLLHPGLGFVVGVAGSELAESLLVNLVRPHLDDAGLAAALVEAGTLEADVADYGVALADGDEGLRRLTAELAARPVLRSLTDRILVWYDHSCLPQPPRDPADEPVFRAGLGELNAAQLLGRTVVLLDEPEDYLSRAWCTLEALVADTVAGAADLLVGSERDDGDGRTEHVVATLLQDRPHLVWRGVLDTEVFRVQTPAECLRRLGLAATDPADLGFVYDRLRGLRAPGKVHTNASDVITGVLPLPVTDDGRIVLPTTADRRTEGPAELRRDTLDWTGSLGLGGRPPARPAAEVPPLLRTGEPGGCHVAVLAACEGEAVLIADWVLDRLAELGELLGERVSSLSWISADIAPVGELSCGTLRAEQVRAPHWVLAGGSARLRHGTIAPALRNALAVARLPFTEIRLDETEGNVVRHAPAAEPAEPPRLLPAGSPLPVHPGGLLRAHLVEWLA